MKGEFCLGALVEGFPQPLVTSSQHRTLTAEICQGRLGLRNEVRMKRLMWSEGNNMKTELVEGEEQNNAAEEIIQSQHFNLGASVLHAFFMLVMSVI